MRKFLRAAVVGLLLPAALAGPAMADTLDKVQRDGAMRAGIALFEPWAMQSKLGRLMGFEVEVARKVAEDIGVEARFVQMPFDILIEALEQERIDVIITGLTITPQRALRVAFSRPYATSGVSLATNLGLTEGLDNVAALNAPGMRVGARLGTTSAELARRVFAKAELETFDTDELAFDALIAGDLHAVLSHAPKPRFEQMRNPGVIGTPLDRPLIETAEAFAVRHGDARFLNVLNAWVEARSRDGWLASAHDYWFGGLEWFDEVAR